MKYIELGNMHAIKEDFLSGFITNRMRCLQAAQEVTGRRTEQV
jgi:hypothetical protein